MLLTATLLGLIAALGILDGRLLGVSMIDRPLVMCALTGLVCGNLHEGILIGATLELIFLGNVAIGAAHPPDIVTAPYWPPRFRSCPVVVQRLRSPSPSLSQCWRRRWESWCAW